jgi:CO/xanthine dehydrogenase FAD-binding subunit
MASTPFDYVGVTEFGDAVRLLAEYGDEAKIIAGGQSLVPMLNLRLARPGILIDINPIGVNEPTADGETLHLPALTRHRTVLAHPLVIRHSPLFADAASYVGNVRVRNRGTLGGSLAHCDPTSEFAACALVLHATVTVLGEEGERRIDADDLFVSYLTTSLGPTEVVTGVDVPVCRERQGWSFQEMVRRTSDFAIVAVAVRLELDGSADRIRTADVAIAGTSERVERVSAETLAELIGSSGEPEVFGRVAAVVAASTDPSTDVHASDGYRKELVNVLTRRGLTEAFTRATGGVG